MKKIFKSKITMVILACLLLVGVFAGVSAMAENEKTLDIAGVNIVHDGMVKIHYDVNVEGYDLVENNLKIYFWGTKDIKDENGNYIAPDMKSDVNENQTVTVNGVQYERVFSKGFAPAEMTQVVYAQAVIEDADGNVVARADNDEIVRYSVFEHICWLNYNSSDEDDLALFNAMEDYITYAQKYLGWKANSSPEDLYYLQVNGGYIKPMDGTDNKYSSGVYKKDTCITIVPYDVEAFGDWYNELGGNLVGDKVSTDKTYSFTLEDDRIYTAISKVTVSVENGEIVALTKKADQWGTYYIPNGANVTESADIAGYCAVTAKHSIEESGETKYFKHWVDAEGTVVSDSMTYMINTMDVGFESISYRAVYDTEPAYISNFVSKTASGTTTNDDTITVDGSTFNITTANGTNAGTGFNFDATAENVIVPTRLYHTMTVNLADANGDADGYGALTDYVSTGNPCYAQFKFGSPNVNFAWFFLIVNKDTSGNAVGLHLAMRYNNTSGSQTDIPLRSANMDIGANNELSFEIITKKNSNGTYSQDYVNVYVNGEFLMRGTKPTPDATFSASSTYRMNVMTNSATHGSLTISDMKCYCTVVESAE